MENTVVCPKCHSSQLSAHKRGFGITRTILISVITFGLFIPVAIIIGAMGRNKVRVTCLSCGNRFKAGKGLKLAMPVKAVNNHPPMLPSIEIKTRIL